MRRIFIIPSVPVLQLLGLHESVCGATSVPLYIVAATPAYFVNKRF